ncbi:MAG: radical SAM protein [Candidatus Hodarchaeota archaeon]
MVVLNLIVNNVCNLDCGYCYVDSKKPGDPEGGLKYLPVEEMDFIFKTLEKNGLDVDMVHIFGGEPFLHPRLKDICFIINDANIPINIATNGTLMEVHARWIHKFDVSLSVNLIPNDDAINKILGSRFPLERVMLASRNMVESGIDVNGIVCVFPVGVNARENGTYYADYLHDLNEQTGIENFFLLYFSRLGRGRKVWDNIDNKFYNADNWTLFLKSVRDETKKKDFSYHVYVEPAFDSDIHPSLPPMYMQCDMIIQGNLVVDYNLDMYPCILMQEVRDARWRKNLKENTGNITNVFIESQHDFISEEGTVCRSCTELKFCCPCIPYIQENGMDYRCKGNNTNQTPMGCPLVTIKLV